MTSMTLEETILNQELENVDLSKITALQQKRTIAFINHFVLTNVQFFNNFLRKCEETLMNFERKLEKINAAMVLLEARLSSIPELGTPTTDTPTDVADSKPPDEGAAKPPDAGAANPPDTSAAKPDADASKPPNIGAAKPSAEIQKTPSKEKPDSQSETSAKVAETVVESKSRPEYDRFVKMVNVGVPLPAVKLKITQEGLDPSVLDELLGK